MKKTLPLLIIFPLFFGACDNPFMEQILEPKTVDFESNGGSSVASQTVFKGHTVIRPDDPVLSGSVFCGWFVDNFTFENEWDFDHVPAGNMTLYAKWTDGDDEAHFINSAAITVTGPMMGYEPNPAASGSGNFAIGEVSWSPEDNPFLGGVEYTATVTLTAHDEYAFASDFTATINAQAAVITENTGRTATLSLTFAATDERKFTGISVKHSPGWSIQAAKTSICPLLLCLFLTITAKKTTCRLPILFLKIFPQVPQMVRRLSVLSMTAGLLPCRLASIQRTPVL